MKGQYLAVESLLSFGLGLTLAIGIIGSFEVYSSGIYTVSEDVQVKNIQNEVVSSLNTLQSVKGSARKELNLPESLAGKNYNVEIDENIVVEVGAQEYEKPISIDGSIDGSGSGTVLLTKSGNEYRLRDN